MSFSAAKQGDTVSMLIEGHLVVGNRQALKQLVFDLLSRGERHFRIDFARTRYVDSSGLGVLLAMAKRVSEDGGTLRLANLDADLLTLFELTKLDTLFLYENPASARDTAGDVRSAGGLPVADRRETAHRAEAPPAP